MTVVVFFDDAGIAAWARDRVHALAVKHRCRVIVLDGTQGEGLHEVASSCDTHQVCVKTRGDWIELGVQGAEPAPLQSAIAALQLRDAPVVLLWAAGGIESDPRFAELSAHEATIVYNSSLLDVEDVALRELIRFSRQSPDASINDLAYLRLAPWQESVALFFDGRDVIHELFDLRRVDITCGSAAEAYYLLGWLASRLEWTPCSQRQFCNRFGTQIDFTIVREGLPRRIRRVVLASSQTTFVAEVVDDAAEAIALTISGPNPQAGRCHPIANIDIATLVERAILTGHNDRVFRATLAAAGDILDSTGSSL